MIHASPPGLPEEIFDFPLLGLAEEVLLGAGYEITRKEFDGVPMLLAENSDNVVAVAAVLTVDAMMEAETITATGLVRLMESPTYRQKRWDGYVVLLTGQEPLPAMSSLLFEANYNLRFVRRLLKAGVSLDAVAVEDALISVLPMRETRFAAGLTPPLVRVSELLIERGVESPEIELATSRFLARSQNDGPSILDEELAEEDE